MAYSATLFNTNALYQIIAQVGHGFSVGQALAFNGTDFVLAQANSTANANQFVGIVGAIEDNDHFWLTQEGYIFDSTSVDVPYTPGTLYYLSATVAGRLTATKPSSVGNVVIPCFIAYTTTDGFFFGSVGQQVTSGPFNNWVTVTTSTSMAVNTGYFVSVAAPANMLLPPVAAVGDIVEIVSKSTQQIIVTQNTLQQAFYLNEFTTIGAGGSIEMLQTDGVYCGSIKLVCSVVNEEWEVLYGSGNWQYN